MTSVADSVASFVFAHPDGATREEVGDALGLTADQVRQIEVAALAKMRARCLAAGIDATALAGVIVPAAHARRAVAAGEASVDDPHHRHPGFRLPGARDGAWAQLAAWCSRHEAVDSEPPPEVFESDYGRRLSTLLDDLERATERAVVAGEVCELARTIEEQNAQIAACVMGMELLGTAA